MTAIDVDERPVGSRREAAPSGPSRGITRFVRSTLFTLSVLALACVVYVLVLGPVQEQRSQRRLWATLREQFALQTSPIGGAIRSGAPVGRIDIDAIGVRDLVFIEGTGPSELQAGPGHRRDTVLPGQPGVAVLMGRGWLFGGPFGKIDRLESGDPIVVTTGQGTFTYQVDRVRRAGDPLAATPDRGSGRLTLISSERPAGGGTWDRSTVFVDASLQDRPQPADLDRDTTLATAEAPMRSDPSALLPLLGWFVALAVAFGALSWAKVRWGRRQALLVGVPVVLALMWVAAESATRLVPNLL